MKNKKRNGFTLVELLVVIAILAILATVSVLGYTSFVKKANQTKCDTEMEQIKSFMVADLNDDQIIEFENSTNKYKITIDDEKEIKFYSTSGTDLEKELKETEVVACLTAFMSIEDLKDLGGSLSYSDEQFTYTLGDFSSTFKLFE